MKPNHIYTLPSSSTTSLASSSDHDFLSQPSSSSESSSSDRPFKRHRSRKRGKKQQLTPLKTDLTAYHPPSGSLSPSTILRLCCSRVPALTHSSLPTPPSHTGMPSPTSIPIATTPGSESPICRTSRWDELEVYVHALEESGYPPAFDEAGWHLFLLLDSDILATRRPYRRFLQYTGEMAQLLVNALQWILQFHPSLEDLQKRKFLKALLRLSQRSRKLPRVYHVSGIQIGDVAFQSPGVDIYKGVHQGRVVCLKKYRAFAPAIRDEMTEMSIKETVLWFNYRHIGILPFEGIFQTGSNFESAYLVSPFLEYGTVMNFIRLHSGVDRRLLIRDVLRAIVFLHENKVVHGDIKGCNVLVNASGRAILADLGLSRLSDRDLLTWTSIQTTNPTLGTLPWLAPELLKAQQPMVPTTASDVYALGCFTYEVFTGQTPFWEITQAGGYGVAHRISTEVVAFGRRPRKPSLSSDPYRRYGLTEEIWRMMDSCWEREVKLRPTASQLLQQPILMDLVDGRPSILED